MARGNGTGAIFASSQPSTMQEISFTIAKLLEATFKILPALGWLPVTAFSLIMFLGMLYWLNLQGRYNRKAKQNGTLA